MKANGADAFVGTARGRQVVRRVREAGEGHRDVVAAALVEESQGVGAREIHGDAFVYPEGQGRAHARHDEVVLPWRVKLLKSAS